MGFHDWDQGVKYDWDPDKARSNVRRHGVSFIEAATVMSNPLVISELDLGHSDSDERWLWIGWSSMGRLLSVVTSERGPHPRVISARRATKRECDVYFRRRRSRP